MFIGKRESIVKIRWTMLKFVGVFWGVVSRAEDHWAVMLMPACWILSRVWFWTVVLSWLPRLLSCHGFREGERTRMMECTSVCVLCYRGVRGVEYFEGFSAHAVSQACWECSFSPSHSQSVARESEPESIDNQVVHVIARIIFCTVFQCRYTSWFNTLLLACFSTSSAILDPFKSSTLRVVLCSHKAVASFVPPSLWNEFSATSSVSSVLLTHSASAILMIVVSPVVTWPREHVTWHQCAHHMTLTKQVAW